MGISQSLYTGWTGMATHQKSLDNIGNNLSNVNTTGFKKSEFMFTNLLNQVISTALPEDGPRGSINAKTIGDGVTTGAIATNFSQGTIDPTGNPLDVAMNGNGFFLVKTTSGTALTRMGSFYLDHAESPNQRYLCATGGLKVQGWNAVNGTVTPSQTMQDITLPAIGDMLAGRVTTSATLSGILPTSTSGSDFSGNRTANLDIKGNLGTGNNTLTTHIYAPVTQTDGSTVTAKDEIQEIKVQVAFTGPTLSPDGTVNEWNWTMTTVDWPSAGDPGVQIYPPTDGSSFPQGTISFYAQSDASRKRAAGEPASTEVTPGSTTVKTSVTNPDGTTTTTSFTISSAFNLDVSKMSNLAGGAPGGNALETWSVDGNPKGTMARTVTVYDEFTDFVESTDANGNVVMQAERRVEARPDTLQFAKTGADDAGSDWTWRSSIDDANGTLRFNTQGDLVSSTSSGGSIAYNFDELRSINYEGSVQLTSQDGYRDGYLEDISIDQYGKIFGHYSNSVSDLLAQLAIGTVPNTSGLVGVAGTLYYPGAASGALMIGTAGDSQGTTAGGLAPIGAGLLSVQSLEASNVVLATEFTSLISTERGYQANARVITTSNEMLQQLAAMKR